MMSNGDHIIIKLPNGEQITYKVNSIKELTSTCTIIEAETIISIAATPRCIDCLCRVCIHNICGEGSDTREGCCEGCNNCTGVVETEEDCVRSMYEYAGD